MKITTFIDRNLNEAEEFTIERFNFYFDSRLNFALVDSHTVVVIEKDGDVEQLKKEAEKAMRSCLRRHPDFGSLYMDDKHGVVELLNTVYTISEEELSKEEQDRQSVDFGTAFGLREVCRDACKKCRVMAIIEKDNNKG